MPRPRKPTQLHALQGTLRATHRDRAGEPIITDPLGPAPADWPTALQAIWAELAEAIPTGVATRADRLIVEVACRLIREIRDPVRPVSPAMAAQVRACLSSFGLTPADRSRVVTACIKSEHDPDPASQFFSSDG